MDQWASFFFFLSTNCMGNFCLLKNMKNLPTAHVKYLFFLFIHSYDVSASTHGLCNFVHIYMYKEHQPASLYYNFFLYTEYYEITLRFKLTFLLYIVSVLFKSLRQESRCKKNK